MLRIPLLLLLALLALALGAPPAPAAAPAPSSAVVAADPGDEWEEWEDDECLASEEDECWEDEDLCWAEEEEWSDEDPGDEWGDDDWGDEGDWEAECEEEVLAPPVVSALRATPARSGRLRVAFRLDRAGDVTLALRRVGRGKASRACAKPARRRAKAPGSACAAAPSGTVTVAARTGANATTLQRWNGRRLAPGTYRLTATPAAEGARAATATFTLRAPARRR